MQEEEEEVEEEVEGGQTKLVAAAITLLSVTAYNVRYRLNRKMADAYIEPWCLKVLACYWEAIQQTKDGMILLS